MRRPASIYGRRGLLLRLVYLAIAATWWILSAFGRLVRTRSITLCYHGVPDRHKAHFRRQMELVADQARVPADSDKAADAHSRRPHVCITFDDAFANLLSNALPVTCRLQIPVIVFAVTKNPGSRSGWEMAPGHPDASEMTMTEEEIREAAGNSLITFGSHGATHRHLTGLSPDEVAAELSESKDELGRITGHIPEEFAFPYGACNCSVIAAAFAAGYRRVYTLDPGRTRTAGGKWIIGRMPMSPAVWDIEFRLTIAGAYEWLPYIRMTARRIRVAWDRMVKDSRRPEAGWKARLTGL